MKVVDCVRHTDEMSLVVSEVFHDFGAGDEDRTRHHLLGRQRLRRCRNTRVAPGEGLEPPTL